MNGERKLRLVPPPGEPGARGDAADLTPPASEEQLRQARALAEALERRDDPLASALLAATSPAGLDEADHEALIARALGDADAPPTAAERGSAEALRAWLDEPAAPPPPHDVAELVGALRAAWRPAPISELRNEALIARALGARRAEGRRRVLPVTMAALSSLAAAAAALALLFGTSADAPGPGAAAPVELIPSRSTAELFDPATPFPREGGETARIDRIAGARAADLRANRYAAWGVR